MNPLALAVQGLGFGFAMMALQGLLAYVASNLQFSGPDEEDQPDTRIHRQNHALLQLIAAFVASGALE